MITQSYWASHVPKFIHYKANSFIMLYQSTYRKKKKKKKEKKKGGKGGKNCCTSQEKFQLKKKFLALKFESN